MNLTATPPGCFASAWLSLDRHGRVLHASSNAHELLTANADVLTIAGQQLRACREPDRLEQMLRQLRDRGRGAAALTRNDRLPLTLWCQQVDATHDDKPAGATPVRSAWLTLRDPEAELPDLARVRALFGLTACEATVAVGLALGQSSTDIAARMAVQPNTVLTHVKHVLAKTGTRRQAQLVSLLLRSVALVPATYERPPVAAQRPARLGRLGLPVELGISST